jgi:hypothetical protein
LNPEKLELPLEAGDGCIVLPQALVGLTQKVIGLDLERDVKVVYRVLVLEDEPISFFLGVERSEVPQLGVGLHSPTE